MSDRMASIGYDLPEELMIEILVRLPVKSLLKFKCVCKQWCDLIRNPNFITNHFDNPNNHTRLLIPHKTRNISVEEFALIGLPDDTLACQSPLSHEYIHDIIGPVNGLFLLQYSADYGVHLVALWNPATTEFRRLPLPTFKSPPPSFYRYGFGLDPLTNDYKVICIPLPTFKSRRMVALYTLGTGTGTDSWRLIEAEASVVLPLFLWCMTYFVHSRPIYLNGANYWLLGCRNQSRIALFDISSEVFREIKAPDKANNANGNGNVGLNLVLYNDDSIALLVMEFVSASNLVLQSIEMWVMKQGEEEGCWNKHFTLGLGPHLHLCKPLGFWKNDYEIFFETDSDQLVLYNTNTHEIMDLGVCGESILLVMSLAVLNYKESLVSVGGQKAAKRDKLHNL